jgi:hypothetical protein
MTEIPVFVTVMKKQSHVIEFKQQSNFSPLEPVHL